MAEFPSLPLFTDALLADTEHLNNEEMGLYMRILILMWRTPGCRIPNDEKWIRRKLKMRNDMPLFNNSNGLLETLEEFCTCDGNFWTQKRLLKEFNYLKGKREKQKNAAQARWGNKNASAKRQKTPQNAVSKPVPDKSLKKADFDGDLGYAPHPTPPTDVVVDKGPASRAPARDHVRIGQEIAKITGWDSDPNWFGDYSRVDMWLREGFDPEKDILPTVKRLMAGRKNPPKSMKYFEQAISDAHAYRIQPVKKGNPENEENRQYRNGHSSKPTKAERAKDALHKSSIDLGILEERPGGEKEINRDDSGIL